MRPEAYNFAYLIVPGWMGNAFPFYMDCIINKLKKYKLTAVKAKIRTGGTIATNMPMLKAAIEALHAKTQKPILVVAHSKGTKILRHMLHPPVNVQCGLIKAFYINRKLRYDGDFRRVSRSETSCICVDFPSKSIRRCCSRCEYNKLIQKFFFR